MNCLANPQLEGQIRLHRYAVGSRTTAAKWFFDENNPGGSSLFGEDGNGIDVKIRSFADIINDVAGEISLLKIDIEGAEYDILRETPPAVWRQIPAVSLELHHDPRREMSNEQFLDQVKTFGYHIEPEGVCSFFLKR
jgi:FkbM family methyltransferase